MKRLYILLIILFSTFNYTMAQKNICHLIYELSTVDAQTLGTFSSYAISDGIVSDDLWLKTDIIVKYKGVKEVNFEFDDITLADADKTKMHQCKAQIIMTEFNITGNKGESGFKIPKWNDNPMKDTIYSMFEKSIQLIHNTCFSSQLASRILINNDEKNTDLPRYAIYLYSPSLQLPDNLTDNGIRDFFIHKPHILIQAKQSYIYPTCSLEAVLCWQTK